MLSVTGTWQTADLPEVARAASVRAARPAAPTGLSAKAASGKRIDLRWSDESGNETGFRVFRKTPAARSWTLVATLPANQTRYSDRGLTPKTKYEFRVRAIGASGVSGHSNIARVTTTAGIPSPTTAVPYDDPIVITRGGVYSGNWQSLNPNMPAVQIRTSEPVIIENSNIRSRGNLISAYGYAANLTIRNTSGYGLNPNVLRRYPGRFLDVEGFVNVRLENNFMESTSGIYLYDYRGNHTANQTVKVLRNKARNIDGRYSNGKGGFLTGADDNHLVQFFQINGVRNLVGAEIAWNQVINEPGKSRVEDNISIFATSGTSASPFRIHDNYIEGAYPVDPAHQARYSGGGIMLSDVGSAFILAYNNQVLNTTNYGIAISSGHDNEFYNNRVISSGLLPNGSKTVSQNVGVYIWNQNGEKTFARNSGRNNVIGWAQGNGRNDWWVPDASAWTGNTSLAGSVTRTTEAAEWTLWQNKLAGAGISIGTTRA